MKAATSNLRLALRVTPKDEAVRARHKLMAGPLLLRAFVRMRHEHATTNLTGHAGAEGLRRRCAAPAIAAPVIEKTKHHLLDTIAAMVSGSRLLPGKKALAYVKTLGGTKEATVVGLAHRDQAVNAALANGMLAHADETDDSHAPSLTHPGCGIVPAALAMAERERRNGTALAARGGAGLRRRLPRMTLALDGYEFRDVGHLDAQLRPDVRRGRGGRRACGPQRTIRCATCSPTPRSRLGHLVLDARRRAHREGVRLRRHAGAQRRRRRHDGRIAASPASTMCSPASAISSSRTTNRAHRQAAAAGAASCAASATTYEIMNTNIKRWSVGSPIQAPLDSLLDLIREHGIKADDVEKLVVRVSHQGAEHDQQPRHARHQHAAHVRGHAARRQRHLRVRARREAHEATARCSRCAAASSSSATRS